jgi:hypothetical protein
LIHLVRAAPAGREGRGACTEAPHRRHTLTFRLATEGLDAVRLSVAASLTMRRPASSALPTAAGPIEYFLYGQNFHLV